MSPLNRLPRTRWLKLLAGASVASALVALPAQSWASNELAVKTLTEQARFWQNKGRPDLAVAAWKRLLQVDAKNPDALAALAQFEVDNNRPDAAKELLDQLKTQPDASKEAIRRVEGAVALKSVNTQLLDQARAAARAGRAEESVGLYRQMFEGQSIRGPLALEYYQTLGGISTGWDEARTGLAQLATDEPANARVNLAYAQHLTYRAATRREGIRLLSGLTNQSSVSRAALESWRKALIWLEATKADTSLFQAYLSVQPGDAAIKARVSGLNPVYQPPPPDPKVVALRNAFNALNVGDIDSAEKRFQSLLATGPRNPDALGGLGVVRLKQERFGDAEKLLADALRLSGSAKWNEALTAARFWLALEQGDRAAQAGDMAGARREYERAARLDSKQIRPFAALADLLVEEGRLADAERVYREVMAVHPTSIELRRGLAGVLVRQGKVNQALELAEGMSDADKDELGYGSLRAEQYRLIAVQMQARGDNLGAMAQLEEALLWDANSPWLRLELAKLYHKSGATSEAFGLMDGLLQTNPDMPDALHAAALMSAEAQEWTLGLAMLEKIPSKSRTRDMADLQRRLWVNAQIAKADVLTKMGQRALAAQALEQAQTAAGTDANLLAAVAQSTLDLGDETRSLSMMRSLLAQNPKPEVGLLVQYAGLLLKSRQEVELAAQLRHLYGQNLTVDQRKDVDTIRWAYSLRQIDAQREAGNLSSAYEIAAQLLSERPGDVATQQALARVYSSAGEHGRALAWYHQLLQQGQADVPTLVAASGSAVAAGELAYAQSALDTAARMAPSDPSVLSAMGRLAKAQGKNKLAVELFQQAQQVQWAQGQMATANPLGVNLVDYSLPAPAPIQSRTGAGGVPLIPNPLGGRPVTPGTQVRPLMQPTMQPLVQPVMQSPFSQAPAPAPARAVSVPPSDWMAGTPRSEDRVVTASPAVASLRDGMRPVQYQMPAQQPRVVTSVFESPAPAALPAGPLLAPITLMGVPGYSSQPAQAPVAAPNLTFPTSAYPGAATQTTYPGGAPVLQWPVQAIPAQVYPGSIPGLQAAPVMATPPSGGALPASSWGAPAPLAVAGGAMPVARGVSPAGSLQREIDELRADRSSQMSAGGMWRNRSGSAGTSELSDFSTVVQGRFPAGDAGHLVLRLEPVFLSAGSVSSTDFNISQQFGTNALKNVGGATGTVREQQDSGVAVSIGYETARLKMDLGTTPLGFQVQNVVGGVAYNDSIGDVKVKLDVSRRAVTDSILSYAGTLDDVSGKSWGGVTATGGRVELGVEEGPFGLYGYGGFHVLTGRNVVNNNRFEMGGGAYYKLIQDTDMELTAGVNVTALGYKQNLRYFTLGHGGYFSPQRYFSLSLPLEMSGHMGKLSYRVDGSIGVQSFRENSAAYFPGDTTMQANWETVATANAVAAPAGVTWNVFYPGQSKTGLGFRLGGEAEYQFAPKWVVGGKVSVDNATDYTQTSGLVYVRYHFEPIRSPARFPPKVLKVGQ